MACLGMWVGGDGSSMWGGERCEAVVCRTVGVHAGIEQGGQLS